MTADGATTTQTDEKPMPRIVVGVDGSEESKQALRQAVSLAQVLNAQVEAIQVWNLATYGWAVGYLPNWDPQADFKRAIADTLKEVFGETRPSNLTAWVSEGNPAHVLIERSKDALMLIVGNRGRGGFASLLLGSVSSACAAHAQCPVLIVHSAHAHIEDGQAALAEQAAAPAEVS